MMDYGIFKEAVKGSFLSYMPESYQGMEVRVEPVTKVNRKLDGLSLLAEDEKMMVSPTLYVNDMYDQYLRTGDLQAALRETAEAMDAAFREAELPTVDISTAKDNIIFQLINTAQNEDMLKDKPHRNFRTFPLFTAGW